MRLGGMVVDDLPIAEGAAAAEQLPAARETERRNVVEGILARYPDHSVTYLEGRIREARSNIIAFKRERSGVDSQRGEYQSILALCQHRDKLIAAIPEDDPELGAKTKALQSQFGLYQVEGLEKQIVQFGESAERFDQAIAREQADIAELRELVGLCKARDKELANLGA